MLYLSAEKFMEWLPFLISGVAVYYLVSRLYRNYKKNFSVHKSLYYGIAEIIVPLNLLVVISLDLFFLFKGSGIFLINPSVTLLALIFAVLSFYVSYTSFATVNSLYLRNTHSEIRILLSVIVGSVTALSILTILLLEKEFLIVSVAPLLSFFFAPMLAVTLGSRKFNPYALMAVPFFIVIISVAYLILLTMRYPI